MMTFWMAVGAVATVGIFIVGILRGKGNVAPPPRVNMTCEDYPVAGLQIRSNRSGNWNQSAVADNGDVVLDAEYAGSVTSAGVYKKDRKTLLADIILDFTNGNNFQRVRFKV